MTELQNLTSDCKNRLEIQLLLASSSSELIFMYFATIFSLHGWTLKPRTDRRKCGAPVVRAVLGILSIHVFNNKLNLIIGLEFIIPFLNF